MNTQSTTQHRLICLPWKESENIILSRHFDEDTMISLPSSIKGWSYTRACVSLDSYSSYYYFFGTEVFSYVLASK